MIMKIIFKTWYFGASCSKDLFKLEEEAAKYHDLNIIITIIFQCRFYVDSHGDGVGNVVLSSRSRSNISYDISTFFKQRVQQLRENVHSFYFTSFGVFKKRCRDCLLIPLSSACEWGMTKHFFKKEVRLELSLCVVFFSFFYIRL